MAISSGAAAWWIEFAGVCGITVGFLWLVVAYALRVQVRKRLIVFVSLNVFTAFWVLAVALFFALHADIPLVSTISWSVIPMLTASAVTEHIGSE